MKFIEVTIKQQYGNTVIYPACDDAKLFASIAGTKTLTEAALQNIRGLGYKVYQKHYKVKAA